MLRAIISVYKTLFFLYCALMLIGLLGFGLFMAIEGTTAGDRWIGLGFMVGGVFFSAFMAGSLAIMLENNELLRQIAGNVEPSKDGIRGTKSQKERKEGPSVRREPVIGR